METARAFDMSVGKKKSQVLGSKRFRKRTPGLFAK